MDIGQCRVSQISDISIKFDDVMTSSFFFSTFCRARQCPGRDFDPIYFKFKHNVVLDYPCLLLKISNIGHVSNFRFCQEPCPGGPLSARFGAKMATKKKTNKKTSNLGR